MIFDHLSQAKEYHHMGTLFLAGFDYLRTFRPEIADGRYSVRGDDVYALVQTFQTAPAAERTFESHKHYADIHYIVSGSELIYYCQTLKMSPKAAYNPKDDATFYQDNDEYAFTLNAGYFMIFLRHDGHKPACSDPITGPQTVRKVVIKVRL